MSPHLTLYIYIYIYLYLINTGSGTPFISALELRPLYKSLHPFDFGTLTNGWRFDLVIPQVNKSTLSGKSVATLFFDSLFI